MRVDDVRHSLNRIEQSLEVKTPLLGKEYPPWYGQAAGMPHLNAVHHFAARDMAVGTPQPKSRQGKPGHGCHYLYWTMLFEEAHLIVDETSVDLRYDVGVEVR